MKVSYCRDYSSARPNRSFQTLNQHQPALQVFGLVLAKSARVQKLEDQKRFHGKREKFSVVCGLCPLALIAGDQFKLLIQAGKHQ